MTTPIHKPFHPGQAVYVNNAAQGAWREKMLAQALDRVRAVQPLLEQGQNGSPDGLPVRGGILDVYI